MQNSTRLSEGSSIGGNPHTQSGTTFPDYGQSQAQTQTSSEQHPAPHTPQNHNVFNYLADDVNYLLHAGEQALLPHINPLFASAHSFVDSHVQNGTLRHGTNEFIAAVQEHVLKADFVVETGLALLTCTFGGSVAGAFGVKNLLLRGLIVHLGSSRLHQALESVYYGENRMHFVEANKDVRGTMNMGSAEYVGQFAQPVLASFFGGSSLAGRAAAYFAARALGGLTMSLGATVEILGARGLDSVLGIHYFVDEHNNDMSTHFSVQGLTRSFFSDLGMNVGGHIIGSAIHERAQEPDVQSALAPAKQMLARGAEAVRQLLADERGSVDLDGMFGTNKQQAAHELVLGVLQGDQEASRLPGALFDSGLDTSICSPGSMEEFRRDYEQAHSRTFYFDEDGCVAAVELFRENGSRLNRYGADGSVAIAEFVLIDEVAMNEALPQPEQADPVERVSKLETEVSVLMLQLRMRTHTDLRMHVIDLRTNEALSPDEKIKAFTTLLLHLEKNKEGIHEIGLPPEEAAVEAMPADEKAAGRARARRFNQMLADFKIADETITALSAAYQNRTQSVLKSSEKFLNLVRLRRELLTEQKLPLHPENSRPLSVLEFAMLVTPKSKDVEVARYASIFASVIENWAALQLSRDTNVSSDAFALRARDVLKQSSGTLTTVLRAIQKQPELFELTLFEAAAEAAPLAAPVVIKRTATLPPVAHSFESIAVSTRRAEVEAARVEAVRVAEVETAAALNPTRINISKSTERIKKEFKITPETLSSLSEAYQSRIRTVLKTSEKFLNLVRFRRELIAAEKLPLHPENLRPLSILELSILLTQVGGVVGDVYRYTHVLSRVIEKWNNLKLTKNTSIESGEYSTLVRSVLKQWNATIITVLRMIQKNTTGDFELTLFEAVAEAAPLAASVVIKRPATLPPAAHSFEYVTVSTRRTEAEAEAAAARSSKRPAGPPLGTLDALRADWERRGLAVPAMTTRPKAREPLVSIEVKYRGEQDRYSDIIDSLVDKINDTLEAADASSRSVRTALADVIYKLVTEASEATGGNELRISRVQLDFLSILVNKANLKYRSATLSSRETLGDIINKQLESLKGILGIDGNLITVNVNGLANLNQNRTRPLAAPVVVVEARKSTIVPSTGAIAVDVVIPPAAAVPDVALVPEPTNLETPRELAVETAAPSPIQLYLEHERELSFIEAEEILGNLQESYGHIHEAKTLEWNEVLVRAVEVLREMDRSNSLSGDQKKYLANRIRALPDLGLKGPICPEQLELVLSLVEDAQAQGKLQEDFPHIEEILKTIHRHVKEFPNFQKIQNSNPELAKSVFRAKIIITSLLHPQVLQSHEISRALGLMRDIFSLSLKTQNSDLAHILLAELTQAISNEDRAKAFTTLDYRILQQGNPDQAVARLQQLALGEQVLPGAVSDELVHEISKTARPPALVETGDDVPVVVALEIPSAFTTLLEAITTVDDALVHYVTDLNHRRNDDYIPRIDKLIRLRKSIEAAQTKNEREVDLQKTILENIAALIAGPSEADILSSLVKDLNLNADVSFFTTSLSNKAQRGLYIASQKLPSSLRQNLTHFLDNPYVRSSETGVHATKRISRAQEILERMADLHDLGIEGFESLFVTNERDKKLLSRDLENTRIDSANAELGIALNYTLDENFQSGKLGEGVSMAAWDHHSLSAEALEILKSADEKMVGREVSKWNFRSQRVQNSDLVVRDNVGNRILVEIKNYSYTAEPYAPSKVKLILQAFRYGLAYLQDPVSISRVEIVFNKEIPNGVLDVLAHIFSTLKVPYLLRKGRQIVGNSPQYEDLKLTERLLAFDPAKRVPSIFITPPIPVDGNRRSSVPPAEFAGASTPTPAEGGRADTPIPEARTPVPAAAPVAEAVPAPALAPMAATIPIPTPISSRPPVAVAVTVAIEIAVVAATSASETLVSVDAEAAISAREAIVPLPPERAEAVKAVVSEGNGKAKRELRKLQMEVLVEFFDIKLPGGTLSLKSPQDEEIFRQVDGLSFRPKSRLPDMVQWWNNFKSDSNSSYSRLNEPQKREADGLFDEMRVIASRDGSIRGVMVKYFEIAKSIAITLTPSLITEAGAAATIPDTQVRSLLEYLTHKINRNLLLEGLELFALENHDFAAAISPELVREEGSKSVALAATEVNSGASFRTMLRALGEIRARGWDNVDSTITHYRKQFVDAFDEPSEIDLRE